MLRKLRRYRKVQEGHNVSPSSSVVSGSPTSISQVYLWEQAYLVVSVDSGSISAGLLEGTGRLISIPQYIYIPVTNSEEHMFEEFAMPNGQFAEKAHL